MTDFEPLFFRHPVTESRIETETLKLSCRIPDEKAPILTQRRMINGPDPKTVHENEPLDPASLHPRMRALRPCQTRSFLPDFAGHFMLG